MNFALGDYLLRRPEPGDLDALYRFKNDPDSAAQLVGFTTGYSMQDLRDWLEFHRKKSDEVLFAIASAADDACIGHAGLYSIDMRVGMAEFGILIGPRELRGKGIGRACTLACLEYGFHQLNLNRIYLSVLAENRRARHLYASVGFQEEGTLRQAQFKNGRYLDINMMSILRGEYESSRRSADEGSGASTA